MWQDGAMIGRFRLADTILALDARYIRRVATLEEVHQFPFLPPVLTGLILVDNELVPLIQPSLLLPREAARARFRRAVVVTLDDGCFAFPIDELLTLDEETAAEDSAVLIDTAQLWQRLTDEQQLADGIKHTDEREFEDGNGDGP